ncbi:MAG: TlpA family protein disulfide reductase [Planctomycetes bacterium]|nr:TlpA family protein disulfide reductase [Planctomycetota bacterium]
MAADDIEGARKTYDRMAALVPGAQQIEQFVAQKKASLEMIGEEPKAFDVKDAAGQPLSLAKYKGKVVLLDFWATWCGPCRAELPNVIATYKKYHDKGFEIVGVSLDEDEQAFKDFIKSKGMTWSQFFDGKGWKNEVSVLYGVQSIPQTYLIDTSGKIYRIGLRGDALGRTVNALLAKSAKDPTKKP